MILKQFDPNKKAIINPEDIIEVIDGFPEIVVSCFERTTFSRMVERYKGIKIGRLSIANLEVFIYKIEYKGLNIAIFNSYVGSPGCVGFLEELYVMGMKKLVLFGTCGILNHDIDDVSIIIPNRAVRDEGTSYHYAPASDEIDVNIDTLNAFEEYLTKESISYTKGKVWTTDAMYRETIDKMKRRRDNGCIAVDMECSAVAALAKFRGIKVLHFFYAADHLSEEIWERRSLSNGSSIEAKDIVANIALEFSKNM